ncbi:hypothetical protein [Actinoplanes regularis]|uniref:DUF8094 domain-containing protein n=1 Tax=Actinoplanes regularis TaxID=52697 RepID=A0A239HES1_9ACTN|nr:hypothetical protein [Actinoplanes regularis]GIE91028.1 hypothetical protein Are01nite_75080 [Actinoplanes regularis]SNS79899.1 hypothetical protein SAMN06264365_12467 [Actinoplanes regularis]
MSRLRPSRSPLAGGILAVLLGFGLTGCARSETAAAAPGPAPAFGVPAATEVLAAFDNADSAATVAGDVAGLRTSEVSPSLDGSVAAVNKARLVKRNQPGFRHVDPVFALPADDAGCFLVTAKLRLTGEELRMTDVSHFLRTPEGSWKLSHNVQIGPDGQAALASLGSASAVASAEALPDELRQRLAAQLFTRTIGSEAPDTTLVASNVLLDRRFAGGWAVYTQQMQGVGMTVARTFSRAQWSDCAARTSAGTLAFVTLAVSDTITGKAASLTPDAPDMAALGRSAAVHGRSIRIARLQTFLLLVPPDGTAPAKLLGLADAPVSLDVAK